MRAQCLAASPPVTSTCVCAQARESNLSLFLNIQVFLLEAESQQLREALQTKNVTIKSMERRVAGMEVEVQDLLLKVRKA